MRASRKEKGTVYLVGAGPGDPGLLTVRAMRLLERADLVVYDTLVNPDHLRRVRRSAVKLCVGRGFRHRRLSQRRVYRTILSWARAGRLVVRLKGGDPYLFGRGGEEALFLRRHGIPFQVVPGVTSAVSCAAYAGIPLTHRDHNASVTFLTGHRASDETLLSIPWEKIAALEGTLVVYMGFYNLSTIARRLMDAGVSPSRKACVVEWGTLPRQRSCEGTLATIVSRVRRAKMKPPCLVIIGEVVSLRQHLNWYERLPFFGKKVVITRSAERASSLKEKLEERGAEVIEMPVIAVQRVRACGAMDRAIRDLPRFHWAVFTSVHGVDAVWARLAELGKDARVFGSVRLAAVGPETAAALERRGLRADLVPSKYETAAVGLALSGVSKDRAVRPRVLLFRSNLAPPLLQSALRRAGMEVRNVVAYRTVFCNRAPAPALRALRDDVVHAVTFTSSSTVHSFAKILGARAFRRLSKRTRFASIGPVTSSALRLCGARVACEAAEYTIDGLVRAMEKMR